MLRYEGNIVLTVKLYDTSCCFKDFATQFADLATRKSSAASHTLQFVKVLPRDSMDVMQIPDNFVCCYIPKAQRNSQVAIIFSSLGKFWHIGFDSNESGVFLRGNWLEFLEAHDLSEGNILVFRYEGSMVFTVKRLNPLGTRKCTMPRELVFSQYTWTDGKQHRITTFSRRDSSSKEERVPISAQTLKRKATSSTTGVISIDWCQAMHEVRGLRPEELRKYSNIQVRTGSSESLIGTRKNSVRSYSHCSGAFGNVHHNV